MASASGLATGYGPQVHGTSINTFNGSQLFPKFQQDLQKNCLFQHFSLMSDNADDKFEAMCVCSTFQDDNHLADIQLDWIVYLLFKRRHCKQ